MDTLTWIAQVYCILFISLLQKMKGFNCFMIVLGRNMSGLFLTALCQRKRCLLFKAFPSRETLKCTSLYQLTVLTQTELRQGRTGRSNLHKHAVAHVNCQEKEQHASELKASCREDRRCYSGKVKFLFHVRSHVRKLRSIISF